MDRPEEEKTDVAPFLKILVGSVLNSYGRGSGPCGTTQFKLQLAIEILLESLIISRFSIVPSMIG